MLPPRQRAAGILFTTDTVRLNQNIKVAGREKTRATTRYAKCFVLLFQPIVNVKMWFYFENFVMLCTSVKGSAGTIWSLLEKVTNKVKTRKISRKNWTNYK